MALVRGSAVSAVLASAATSISTTALILPLGNFIYVGVALANTSVSVSGITDTASPPNIYTFIASSTSGTGVRVELWGAPITTASAVAVTTATFTGSTIAASCLVIYAGAVSSFLGNHATGSGNSQGYDCNIQVTTQDQGNFVVGAIAYVAPATGTLSSIQNGSNRILVGNPIVFPNLVIVFLEAFGPSPGLYGCGISLSPSAEPWAGVVSELRTHATPLVTSVVNEIQSGSLNTFVTVSEFLVLTPPLRDIPAFGGNTSF